jgi:hypothetical protein
LTQIFLPPPFDAPAVLAAVLGAPHHRLRPATLEGHALRADSAGPRVGLAPEPGASVDGALLPASPEAVARLDFAMAALGAEREAVAARTGGDELPAEAYRFPPDAAAELDPPPRRAPSTSPASSRR